MKFFQTDEIDKEAFLLDDKSLTIDVAKVRPDIKKIIIGYKDTKDLIIFSVLDGENKSILIGTENEK
jgi:hypothetical protein